jgi:hypothetical protein
LTVLTDYYRYGGQLLASHEYSTAQFFLVFVAIVLGAQSSGQFFAHSLDIMKGKNAYNAVRSLGKNVLTDFDESSGEVQKYSSTVSLIEFQNARFAYPARPTQPVLRSLDLKVKSHDSGSPLYSLIISCRSTKANSSLLSVHLDVGSRRFWAYWKGMFKSHNRWLLRNVRSEYSVM